MSISALLLLNREATLSPLGDSPPPAPRGKKRPATKRGGGRGREGWMEGGMVELFGLLLLIIILFLFAMLHIQGPYSLATAATAATEGGAGGGGRRSGNIFLYISVTREPK